MADENTQVGQAQGQSQVQPDAQAQGNIAVEPINHVAPMVTPSQSEVSQAVDLRAEKAVIDEKGEVVATSKESKLGVAELEAVAGKVVASLPRVNTQDLSKVATQATTAVTGAVKDIAKKLNISEIKDPVERMKQGVSVNMPKIKKTVFENVKGMFVKAQDATKSTVEKVDQMENLKKETGEKVVITQAERQKYVEAEKIYQDGLASIKDLIAPASMEINYDTIRLDGMYARSFYVYAYPRFLNTNWLSPVINFDVTMDMSQFIYPINSADIMNTLKKKVAQMRSSMSIAAEKGQVSDPGLETALEDAETLRREIQKGTEKFFQFALYFTVYSDDDKKLERISKQLESLLAGKLVLTKRCQVQAEHGFNSTVPQCLDELDTVRNMNTSPLSTTFPFTSSDLTSNEGILYGINRHNDSLIIFDRFNLENANSVVFAKSGAGKSYAVKLEVLRMMMLGTDVIIIDPENEYESLSQTVGGTYLKLSLNSDRRINPFDLPKPIEGDTVLPGDLVRSAVINLHGLMKLMLGAMTPEEESLLDKALIDVYALKGITMEVTDPSSFEPPTMEDLHNILSSMEGASSLTKRIEKYTSGSFAGIFNKPTNIDMNSGLMTFCIRDLEDELRPTAMYIILNFIWNKVRSQLKKRILVIDEAWTMMQHEDSAKFLYGLVKRARKYYLGVTTITQDVEDFVKSAYGKPIITNSSMQLLLKQAPAAIDVLAALFNLTEGERYVLLNSDVGQGLFFAGNRHVAIQIIASYLEDQIVTTNPEQILKSRAENVEFETTEDAEEAGSDNVLQKEVAPVEAVTEVEAVAEETKVDEVSNGAQEEAPVESSVEETPTEETPVEETPVEETPTEETPTTQE